MSAYSTQSQYSSVPEITERIAVEQGEEPADWQGIYDCLNARASKFSPALFNIAVVFSTFLGLFAALGSMAFVIKQFFPAISYPLLVCLVSPPGFLVGAATGQAGGNLFMRVLFGLDDATRRGFATRLTLGRAPAAWNDAVCRWLFTGNWMSSPFYDPRLPYVRIFVMGSAPSSCREEDSLWREIHNQIAGDSHWETGANHREISYPRELPAWAKRLENGEGIEGLKKRIGEKTASEWVMHLWRRACRQWPILGGEDYPVESRRECFEIHSLPLSSGREALVVVLRPSCFAAEMAEEAKLRKKIAA